MRTKIALLFIGLMVVPFALIVGGRIPYLLLYTYLLTLLLPFLHSLLGKYFIQVIVKVPEGELVAGEEIKIHYEIRNPSGLTFPRLVFHNELVYRLTGKQEPEIQFHLKKKESYWGQTTVQCVRRGNFTLGKGRLIIKDIFDLYRLKKVANVPLALTIYPRVVTLKSLKIQASQQMGELVVKNPLFQDYAALSDLRVYQPGDSLKKVHWKASAKTDTLMVKNFEEQGDHGVIVMLDSCRNNYFFDQEAFIEDKLVEAAASIIDFCLGQNIKVSLYYRDTGGTRIMTGNQAGYFKGFLDQLVTFHPVDTVDFYREIEGNLPNIQQGSTLFLLTPFLGKELAAQGIRLKMKNLQPVYLIIGSEEGSPHISRQNKEMAKKLGGEGIPLYLLDVEQDIRDVLEEKYEKGA